MRSLAHKPVTIGHPSQPVTSDNWREHSVGETLASIERDGDHVRGDLILRDASAIQQIEKGLVQLSVGYRVRVDFESG